MKRTILIITLLAIIDASIAQNRIEYQTNIFGDIEYRNNNHRATLKKDIFDNLVYTDNRQNKASYSNDYIKLVFNTNSDNKELQQDLFKDLIRKFQFEERYEEEYKIDIFGKVIYKNNRGDNIKTDPEFVENSIHNHKHPQITNRPTPQNNYRIIKDRNGNYKYEGRRGEQATLEKLKFNTYRYEDSERNSFQFSPNGWKRAMRKYNNPENFLNYLIDTYIYN